MDFFLAPYREEPEDHPDPAVRAYVAIIKAAHTAPVHSSYAEAICKHAEELLHLALAGRKEK